MSNPSSSSSADTKRSQNRVWQGNQSSGNQIVAPLLTRWREALWGILLVVAIAMFAWWIWLLILSPKRTIVATLVADQYIWPLPPNDWVAEDLERLSILDGETISITGNDDPVRTRDSFFEKLDRHIQRYKQRGDGTPLILYLSLHGVADPAGEKVHLVPPQASPHDRSTWIDFEDILQRVDAIAGNRKTLIVIDGCRIQVDWNLGLKNNVFSAKLQTQFQNWEWTHQDDSNVGLLISADAEQRSVSSAELGGSAFGTYFQLGLAGLADRKSESGNEDGWVDVKELHQFVSAHVSRFARSQRSVNQRPALLLADADGNFQLSRSGNEAFLRSLRRPKAVSPIERNLPSSRLDSYWSLLDDLRSGKLYRAEPVGFRDLEHKLLWLEQLAVAGKGYTSLAKRTSQKVKQQLDDVKGRVETLSRQPTLERSTSPLTGRASDIPKTLTVHSLALAEFFGAEDSSSSRQLGEAYQELQRLPGAAALESANVSFEKVAHSEYSSGWFLKILDRYETSHLWSHEENVRRLLRSQWDVDRLASPTCDATSYFDLRVHRWTRSLLSDVDKHRRNAEDLILSRNQTGIGQSLDALKASVETVTSGTTSVHEAMAACDEAMAITPYLAQWIGHPERSTPADNTRKEIDETLIPLIENTARLSELLAVVPAAGSNANEMLEKIESIDRFARGQVMTKLAGLKDRIRKDSVDVVIESDENRPHTIGKIQALLSIPLLDWKSRRTLRETLAALSLRVFEKGAESAAKEDVSEGMSRSTYSEQIGEWTQHPLDALMAQSDVNTTSAASGLFATINAIRDQVTLAMFEHQLVERRRQYQGAARSIRALSAVWFDDSDFDPVGALLTADVQELLLWHGHRTLDDFWGPAGNDRAFFELAAYDDCESVEQVERSHVAANGDQVPLVELEGLRNRLSAAKQLANSLFVTTTSQTLQIDSADDVFSKVSVRTAEENILGSLMGSATLMARSDGQRVDLPDVSPDDIVRPASDLSHFQISLAANKIARGVPIRVDAVYRGHEYGTPLPVEPFSGPKVVVVPQTDERSRVTLSGPWDRLSVLFVVDCSASMGDLLDSDGDQEKRRIEIAKESLQEILFRLSVRQNVQAGVIAFGNRMGWSVDKPVELLVRPDLTSDWDPGISPASDVQQLLPLTDLNLDVAKGLGPTIDQLKAWGQSPLYLSVQQAIQEFSKQDADAERHVIVITDGANYQYSPSGAEPVTETSANDVRASVSQTPIPVHILGLGMDREQDREAIEEFTELCFDTGGRYQSLTGATDLNQAMQELLGLGDYDLIPLDDPNRVAQRAMLGGAIAVSPLPKDPERFAVRFEGTRRTESVGAATVAQTDVILEGGESYQLFVNEEGNDILAFAYDANVVETLALSAPKGDPTEQFFRVHGPKQSPDGRVIFPVSWQRRDRASRSTGIDLWRPTRRPTNVWIEIEPVDENGKVVGQKYVFFDVQYETDQPVPLMHLVASNWPEDARRGRLRVWSKPAGERPGLRLVAPSTEKPASTSDAGFRSVFALAEADRDDGIEVVSGVRLRLDPSSRAGKQPTNRLRLILDYADSDRDVSSIKLTLPSSQQQPISRIVRQFDAQKQVAVHTFYFDADRVDLSLPVTITDQAHETSGAWELEQGTIEIPMPSQSGLLPAGGF